jgi:amidase
MTWPWNLLNRYPVMGVPLGVVEDRMPSGMQAIADTFDDLTVFQFANGWSKLRPPLYVDGQFPTFARG